MKLADDPENKFYVIEVTNLLGKKGYVIETPEGIKFVVRGFHGNTTQFTTEDDARTYVKEKKIFKIGKIKIVSNQDIIQQYAKPATGDVYVIMNEKDQSLFFDNAKETYYFDNRHAGACAWFNKGEVDEAVKNLQFAFPTHALIAVQINDPGAKPINE